MSQKKFPMYNKFEYQIFFLVIVCVGVDSDYFNILSPSEQKIIWKLKVVYQNVGN